MISSLVSVVDSYDTFEIILDTVNLIKLKLVTCDAIVEISDVRLSADDSHIVEFYVIIILKYMIPEVVGRQ